jgi:CDP-paratose synthetase
LNHAHAKTALVTGATGFIGSALTHKLLRDGFRVRALTAGRDQSLLGDIAHHIDWYPYSNEGIQNATSGITHYFHFSVVYDLEKNSNEYINEININLPFLIVQHTELNKLPVSCIFGDSFYRKFPPNATRQTRYTNSKIAFSKAIRDYAQTSKNKYAMLIIEQVYGPGENLQKAYPKIISHMLKNTDRIALTPGTQSRDFIYIDDVVNAILIIANTDWHGYLEIECGSGKPMPVSNIFKLLKTITNSSSILGFGDLPHDQTIEHSAADTSWLIRKGWDIRMPLNDGLLELVNDVKQRMEQIRP